MTFRNKGMFIKFIGLFLIGVGSVSFARLAMFYADGIIPRSLTHFFLYFFSGITFFSGQYLFSFSKRFLVIEVSSEQSPALHIPGKYILYLRAFQSDAAGSILCEQSSFILANTNFLTFDEILFKVLGEAGEVIYLKNPSESLPYPGPPIVAAGENWRDDVAGFMKNCAITIVKAGISDGIKVELELALSLLLPNKFFIFVPSTDEGFLIRFKELFPAEMTLPSLSSGPKKMFQIIAFDDNWNGYFLLDNHVAVTAGIFSLKTYFEKEVRAAFSPILKEHLR